MSNKQPKTTRALKNVMTFNLVAFVFFGLWEVAVFGMDRMRFMGSYSWNQLLNNPAELVGEVIWHLLALVIIYHTYFWKGLRPYSRYYQILLVIGYIGVAINLIAVGGLVFLPDYIMQYIQEQRALIDQLMAAA